MSISCLATPLDDKIAAYKQSDTQTETKVVEILKLGLDEHRSAQALAIVRPWLSSNRGESQALHFYAGRTMQYTGDWQDAVLFYRRLLKYKSLDEKLGAYVVPALYRLMINDMRDEETAYLFMRDSGNRLRRYGRARQFDKWFLDRARQRKDLAATAERLATVFADNTAKISDYEGFIDSLMSSLEQYGKQDKYLVDAMNKLAAASAVRRPVIKARWDWIREVTKLNPKVIDCVENKREVPAELFTAALDAAMALVMHDPQDARLAALGWAQWVQWYDDKFKAFVSVQRDLKAKPILSALDRLPTVEARKLLNYSCRVPRRKGRDSDKFREVPVLSFFSPQQRMALARSKPQLMSTIDAPNLVLFYPKMSLADARALAPHLKNNPHKDAALIRAYAAAGQATVAAMVPYLMKGERWRFSDARQVVEAVWNSGANRAGVDYNALTKQYASQGARYEQIKQQIAAGADSQNRLAAFDALYKELQGTPSTPGVFSLWESLMGKAPIPDKVRMLQRLTSDLAAASDEARATDQYLLQLAIEPMRFGREWAKVGLGPGFSRQWLGAGGDDCRKNLPDLAGHLAVLLRQQMNSGKLSRPLFGLWLHCVEPRKKESLTLMRALAKSPAYIALGREYHAMASHLFRDEAWPEGEKPVSSEGISRELLALPDNAGPVQVQTALTAVLTRVNASSEPVAVLGLNKINSLPEINSSTRRLALALFNGFSPLGEYPVQEGYEDLGLRLIKDMRNGKRWHEIVPYASSMWRAARSPDNRREPRLAKALTAYGEDALAAGQPSVAFSVARIGLRSQALKGSESRLSAVIEKATKAMGIVEIDANREDPAYVIHKANAEFQLGNLQSAWELYVKGEALLIPTGDEAGGAAMPLMRKLDVAYLFWLLRRNIDEDRLKAAESLVKGLTLWSREDEDLFSISQQADLQIAYADLAFRAGNLPTARAWYRKVADARENMGSAAQVRAGLGSVKVDRVSRNFSSALEELDRLAYIDDPALRTMVHYARAEVLTDQENYKDALDEVEAVLLRNPNHEDAKILQGQIEIHMRRLIEATEIELGVTREDTVIVPGETLKINLVDPMLNVAGVGVDIEVEVWAKSGDRERVMLHPFGDDNTKYRASVPTELGPPMPGDKTLQVLGKDEIRYGYAKRFRAKIRDLPPDPDTVITIATDAELAFSAGAFPARKGERRMSLDELGLSSAQARLGRRLVRPGNPVYLRITDADRSTTSGIDELAVSLQTSSGDVIRRHLLKETGPYTGVFEGVIPTARAQAMAFASESAPGRDPNMSISSKDYPGWLGKVGSRDALRTFSVDLNDNVALDKMSFAWQGPDKKITHLILETSLDGHNWIERGCYPQGETPWDGRPQIAVIRTKLPSRGKGGVPPVWRENMDRGRLGVGGQYHAASVASLANGGKLPFTSRWKGDDPFVLRYRALFRQTERAERRFQLVGYPQGSTILLIDGSPSNQRDPLLITRELDPGLHSVEVWCYSKTYRDLATAKAKLLCDVPGEEGLKPCPDSMFDPSSFPKEELAAVLGSARLSHRDGGLDVAFDTRTQARLIRMRIYGFQGTAPGLGKVTLSDRSGKAYLPVEYDYMELNENEQLEVLPGDTITARYEDPVTATPGRSQYQGELGVAFNTASVAASFVRYVTTEEGRILQLEPIRRFNLDDAVAFVIDDIDMDSSPKMDVVEFTAVSSGGGKAKLKGVETTPHSGRFVGRIFPVAGKPQRSSELQVPPGGVLTLSYRDEENLRPGIPTDRSVTIEHAMYRTPKLGVYTAQSELLEAGTNGPHRTLSYRYVDEAELGTTDLIALIGGSVAFDVVVPHLALAESSTISAYVQTESGRELARKAGKAPAGAYDITVPGTRKLTGVLDAAKRQVPEGYVTGRGRGPREDSNKKKSALDEGRFSFSAPLKLGETAKQSFAVQSAEDLGVTKGDKSLSVLAGDVVHIGYAWKDEQGQVQWKTTSVRVGSHGFMSVMNADYTEILDRVFVGERIFVRVNAPGLDRGLEREWASVSLRATSGAQAVFRVRETGPHTGLFQGGFQVSYRDGELPAALPSVELSGFPVEYGDEVTVTFAPGGDEPAQVARVAVNMGSDGKIEPFSKRFAGDEMAVRTSFTLSECFFELAKHHRELEQESLARREMEHAKKLLQEAIATHRDDKLRAHAEYLLGNLAQEYADLAKNDQSKLPMYKDALSRFSKIPVDYPESEFADKAQFKTGLVYEKMGESEIAVGEYVKLAYKYPGSEYIPEAMSRLGRNFQKTGQAFKDQADALRDKTDVESLGEVVRLDKLATPEFIKAATIYRKLQERFPEHKLAGLAGLAAAQNYMRAYDYETAITLFAEVIENEEYDGRTIRSQALYWKGLCHESIAGLLRARNAWSRRINEQMVLAKKAYNRVTFDFPESVWAKHARGRLADPAFDKVKVY